MKSVIFKENYIVYEDGKIWSIRRKIFLKGTLQKNGYYKVYVANKNYWYHRVIAEAFYGKSDLTVDHINGKPFDNNLSNLEYITLEENCKRMFKRVGTDHLAKNFGEIPNGSKSVEWNNIKFTSMSKLAKYLNISRYIVKQSIIKEKEIKGFIPKYI